MTKPNRRKRRTDDKQIEGSRQDRRLAWGDSRGNDGPEATPRQTTTGTCAGSEALGVWSQ